MDSDVVTTLLASGEMYLPRRRPAIPDLQATGRRTETLIRSASLLLYHITVSWLLGRHCNGTYTSEGSSSLFYFSVLCGRSWKLHSGVARSAKAFGPPRAAPTLFIKVCGLATAR